MCRIVKPDDIMIILYHKISRVEPTTTPLWHLKVIICLLLYVLCRPKIFGSLDLSAASDWRHSDEDIRLFKCQAGYILVCLIPNC